MGKNELNKVAKMIKLEPEELLEILTEMCSDLVDKQLSGLETLADRIHFLKGEKHGL